MSSSRSFRFLSDARRSVEWNVRRPAPRSPVSNLAGSRVVGPRRVSDGRAKRRMLQEAKEVQCLGVCEVLGVRRRANVVEVVEVNVKSIRGFPRPRAPASTLSKRPDSLARRILGSDPMREDNYEEGASKSRSCATTRAARDTTSSLTRLLWKASTCR